MFVRQREAHSLLSAAPSSADSREKAARARHRGAVGREELRNWQLLVNDQPGGFHRPAVVVSGSRDSRVGRVLPSVHSLGSHCCSRY